MSVKRLRRQVSLTLVLGILALSLAACVSFGAAVPTSTVVPAPDTPTPVIIVVTATTVPSPSATSTPRPPTPTMTPTWTPAAPTATATKPAPSATATATKSPPTATAPPVPTPTPTCQALPVRGFGKVWTSSETVRSYVGCPTNTERGVDYTGQRFEHGVVFFSNPGGFPNDLVVVLFRDNMTWSLVSVPPDSSPGPISGVPAGKFAPQGRIGYVWQQTAGVRARLGWATEPQKSGSVASGTHAAWQAFSQGHLYWIPWNLPDDRYIYAISVAKPYPPGGARYDWLEFKDTFSD